METTKGLQPRGRKRKEVTHVSSDEEVGYAMGAGSDAEEGDASNDILVDRGNEEE